MQHNCTKLRFDAQINWTSNMNSLSCNGPLLCKLNFCIANGWVRQKDPETKPQPPSWVYLMCKWLLHIWTCTSCNSPTSTWGTPALSSNDLMGQTWQPSLAFKEQQLVLRNRMLPSKEDGVILVLHQGQRNSAFFRQDFIKHLGDSERQILVLLNDPWVAGRRMKMLGWFG